MVVGDRKRDKDNKKKWSCKNMDLRQESELLDTEKEQLKMCEFFIYKYFQHASTYENNYSSYGLKHVVEHFFQACHRLGVKFEFDNRRYVSHEVFKIAMEKYGYSYKLDWSGSNRTYKFRYRGPKFWNGFQYCVPVNSDDWDKILNVLRE